MAVTNVTHVQIAKSQRITRSLLLGRILLKQFVYCLTDQFQRLVDFGWFEFLNDRAAPHKLVGFPVNHVNLECSLWLGLAGTSHRRRGPRPLNGILKGSLTLVACVGKRVI